MVLPPETEPFWAGEFTSRRRKDCWCYCGGSSRADSDSEAPPIAWLLTKANPWVASVDVIEAGCRNPISRPRMVRPKRERLSQLHREVGKELLDPHSERNEPRLAQRDAASQRDHTFFIPLTEGVFPVGERISSIREHSEHHELALNLRDVVTAHDLECRRLQDKRVVDPITQETNALGECKLESCHASGHLANLRLLCH